LLTVLLSLCCLLLFFPARCCLCSFGFQAGEKCQLCLARALLRCSKILLLDEATASMDLHTDSLVQASLNESFRGTTILTIAHRLNTVAHYDRILVLDAGRIVEFDSPAALLAKDPLTDPAGAVFAGMVRGTGPTNEQLIRDIAEKAEAERRSAGSGAVIAADAGGVQQLAF
jgi:ABC-type multidrug transport system ATPase subunit